MEEYMKELGIDPSVIEMDDTLPAVAWIRDTDFGETFKEMLEAEGESDENPRRIRFKQFKQQLYCCFQRCT